MSCCCPRVVVTWLTPIVALVALLLAKPVHAEEAPLLSMKRVSLAAGVNHRWQVADRQWVTGLYGAYNLTPHLSLTGSVAYLHLGEKLEQQVGIRIRLWQGSK